MSTDNIIEEIKDRCNIVDVIGRSVQLKKAGSVYKGLCPFHNEKTPSFVVYEDQQLFVCFGCGEKGDVIKFVQKFNNLDFQGAVEKLAGEYGIDLSRSTFRGDSRNETLYEMNRQAAAFFYKAFTSRENEGLKYMLKRGIEPPTLRKFGVGYADGQWDTLYRYLKEQGAEEEMLVSLGLLSHSGERYFDKFRDRVMFPIINTRGKVIGFGGRILGDGAPKYLNSPETPVFQKKNNLYGLNLTRQDINKEDQAILVEGYMDVISLYQQGVRNVAASLGTALTDNQAALLKRYTRNVILCYDADEAGQNAALRGMDILHKAGCRVKVFHVTDGKDPDEYIKKNGKEAFLQLVKEARPFADYKLFVLRQKTDMSTTDGSVAFLKGAAAILRDLSPVEADVYIKKIATEYHISEGALRLEVMEKEYDRRDSGRGAPSDSMEPHTSDPVRTSMLEASFIRLMVADGGFIPRVKPYRDVFRSENGRCIYEMIGSLYTGDGEIDINKLEDGLDEDSRVLLHRILDTIPLAGQNEQLFEDCVSRISGREEKERQRQIIRLLGVLDDEKDKEEIKKLTMELTEIQRKNSVGGDKA